jgi:transketolase
MGLRDTYAEGARSAEYLFGRYGLSAQSIVTAAWQAVGRAGPVPEVHLPAADPGEYAPV